MKPSAEGKADTLVATDYKDPQLVCYGVDGYNQSVTGSKSKTLNNKATDSDHIPLVSYGFDQGATRDVGNLFIEEGSKALTNGTCPGHHNGVVIAEKTGALCARDVKSMKADEGKILYKNSVVRRLTPLECERLQGFPDGWTDIGDWVDSKGKKHKGEADSPRYKALGNSIALPFWQWMAEKMVDVLKEGGCSSTTMASLFDGIGGFPLVYSRVGCKPIWASEIEEFPIAVTKLHFGE